MPVITSVPLKTLPSISGKVFLWNSGTELIAINTNRLQ